MQEPSSIYNEWNPPLSLEGVPLLPWPENVFPEPFAPFVNELARSTETPIELAAMTTLATVATASQTRYQVQIKPDYSEPVNIWPVIILPPAARKSRVFGEVTTPLRTWEREQNELLAPIIQSTVSKRKTMEARLKELRTTAAKANEFEYRALEENIQSVERDLPKEPIPTQIWTSDITPEHLGTIMSANNEAGAIISDEGGIFDILSGLYSDGKANIDLFLQAHSGSPTRVDRGSRPPIFMERPVLTMGLTVQPEVIRNICRNKTFRGRGLLGRFLYVFPESNIGKRSFDEASIDPEIIQQYQKAIQTLLNHPHNIVDGKNCIHTLKLTSEGYDKWLGYAKTVELFMGEEIGHLSHITDWAGKLPGAIARIAALLHIMRYAQQHPWQHQISHEDMASAIKIGHALINHALAVFDLLQQDTAMQIAKTVFQWIKETKPNQFTLRECQRKFRRIKKGDLQPGLEILKDHEVLRELVKKPEIGRPSNIFEVNPHLFKEER